MTSETNAAAAPLRRSSTTYISATIGADGDVLKAAEATRSEAAARLGGDDGLQVESVARIDGGKVGVTWHRGWDEQPESPT